MLPRDSEDIERRELSRLAPRFHIEFSADAPNEFRPSAFRRKHPRQKKQIARLHGFRIRAERLRGRRELDPELDETVLGCHRSEEHTSELQSPCNLVCRLLLEKK